MAALPHEYHTAEEYLALELKAEYKSEYVNGQIYAMAGASLQHNTITANLVRFIGNAFAQRPCRVFSSDMRVKVAGTGMYAYPDVVAVCGALDFDETQQDTLTNPTVLIEVLSPSTEGYDRGEKFAHYRRLESLTDYVLVSQDKSRVEHYVRQDTRWLLTELSVPDDSLHLASIDCVISLSDIFDKIEFPTPSPRLIEQPIDE